MTTRTLDITPTWSAILPVLILALEQGNEEGKHAAREELARMAKIADAHVEQTKGKKDGNDDT